MKKINIKGNKFYNLDCLKGAKKYIKSNSVDLIITDPPYGIDGDKLHKHYNRDESNVVDGYVEVPIEEYNKFSHKWIKEAERILRPGGSIYIVSGYTNLYHILDALRDTNLQEVNHIIWKYNFGVYTKRKYISSHYHILFYEKPPNKKRTFNLQCRYGIEERSADNKSLNYSDREDVWIINREYKPGKVKNKNELPHELLKKMILYSSNKDDLVCDMFLGGFSTAVVSMGLNRKFIGFEISDKIFNVKIEEMKKIQKGFLIDSLRKPKIDQNSKRGDRWKEEEINEVINQYVKLYYKKKNTKKDTIKKLTKQFGRGKWGILRQIDLNRDMINKKKEEFSAQKSFL